MGKKVELLAPAGNYEAFLGAINAGADAVYLGGERFGARAYADNFDAQQILRALHVAHFYGKKIYLTVNTLLKEPELAAVCDYLSPFAKAGLDGVIVQDFGVLSMGPCVTAIRGNACSAVSWAAEAATEGAAPSRAGFPIRCLTAKNGSWKTPIP